MWSDSFAIGVLAYVSVCEGSAVCLESARMRHQQEVEAVMMEEAEKGRRRQVKVKRGVCEGVADNKLVEVVGCN